MRIVFMGTPDFAVMPLRTLVEDGHEVVGVFTQPDKPKNRGMKLQAPPVKDYAIAQGLSVFQPEKVKDGTALGLLQSLRPDLIVVAAYGRILPREILDLPSLGCINIHSSLLPKFRGAAPIHWAILNGETESGVTIMHMVEELDAGDIIAYAKTPIDPDETVGELHDRLSIMGAALLSDTVVEIAAGRAQRSPQDPSGVSFAPMLSRALSPLDWTRPAVSLHNQVRGLTPWPSATATLGGKPFKIWKTKRTEERTQAEPGAIVRTAADGIHMACGDGGVLIIEELQAEGKRRMPAAEYLRGNPL